jgi:hypothetical protein
LSPKRGLLLAVLLALAAVLVRSAANDGRWRRFDRHHLPGFDPYVYVAMAEDPAVFTLAPWGYRVLSPWAARGLSPDDVVRGFRLLAVLGLAAAGPLLHQWLRARGHGAGVALAATGLFYLTPPVDEVFRNPFLAEPLGIVLMLLLLSSLERSSVPGLAAALALGALTKEVFVLFLPGVAAALVARRGRRRGLAAAALVSAAALAAHWGLRHHWAPVPPASAPLVPSLATVGAALLGLVHALPATWVPLFACGLPLAAVGACLPEGRPFLRSHGLLLLSTLALPYAAAVYTGGPEPARTFYADDIPRLLMYALPMLLTLGLTALERAMRSARPARPAAEPVARPWNAAGTVVAVAAAAFPFVALDRYRRADLRGRTDGPYVTAFCRESLAFARRLDRGRLVAYEPRERRYQPGRSDPVHMERMRWFLREGWGPLPQYGMDEVRMREPRAAIVLPCLGPRDLDLGLVVAAEGPARLRIAVNGVPVGEAGAGPDPVRSRFRVPRSALFRGDNTLTLEAPAGDPLPRLESLNLRAAEPGPE